MHTAKDLFVVGRNNGQLGLKKGSEAHLATPK